MENRDPLPTGTVTFLFTDIEGSTRLLHGLGENYAEVMQDHRALMRQAFAKWNGQEVDTQGDSFFVAFPSASDALSAAIESQRSLHDHEWPQAADVRVRMGMHTGEPALGATGYIGVDVHRAARIANAGHGGQILVSSSTEQLLRGDVPDDASLVYLGEHGLKDLSQPEHIFELRILNLPHDFPPLRTLNPDQNNLPSQSTSFFGREDEQAEILERMRNQDCRLLTIVGPGGMGKTRLALQAAAQLIEDFGDGVYFVPLEHLSTPDFLITAIADGIRFNIDQHSEDGEAADQLLQYLRKRSVLIILDNFEHLMDAASFIGTMIEKTQNLKLLVTSRERLNLKSEWTYDLAGLEGEDSKTELAVKSSPAVQLFLERARQADSDFNLSVEQLPEVIRIAKLVDGLPLGIELAAPWVRMLSCKEIADEIESGIEFLASSHRDLPERQRSIQAVLDYSWDLLTEDEKGALSKLAVFRGGFTRSHAKTVAGASIIMLTNLADKSHLKSTQSGRFALHGLSRQYALTKLGEDLDQETATRAKHAETFSELLEGWKDPLKSGHKKEVLHNFGAEIENIRAAWDWILAEGRIDLIGASFEALWLYYDLRSWFDEGFDRFGFSSDALKKIHDGSEEQQLMTGQILIRQSWYAWRLGRYAQAATLANEGLKMFGDSAPKTELALAKHVLGIVDYAEGDLVEAEIELKESLDLWRKSKDPWGESTTLFYQSLVAQARGEFGEADQPYQQGLDLFRDIGFRVGATFSHTSMGNVVRTLGDFMQAKKLCLESLALRREMGDLWGIAACLDTLGVVESGLGELDEAMKAGLESLEIRKSLSDRRGTATSLNNLSHIAYLRDELEQAKRYCEEGLEIRRDLGNRKGIAASLNFFGALSLEMDDIPSATSHTEESLRIREELGAKVGIVNSRNQLGEIALRSAHHKKAEEHFKQAVLDAQAIGAVPMVLSGLLGLAQCDAALGRLNLAVLKLSVVAHHDSSAGEVRNRAQELYVELGQDSPDLQEAWKKGADASLDQLLSELLGE